MYMHIQCFTLPQYTLHGKDNKCCGRVCTVVSMLPASEDNSDLGGVEDDGSQFEFESPLDGH